MWHSRRKQAQLACAASQSNDSVQSSHVHKRSHCGTPMRAAVPGSGPLQVLQQPLTLIDIQDVSKPVPSCNPTQKPHGQLGRLLVPFPASCMHSMTSKLEPIYQRGHPPDGRVAGFGGQHAQDSWRHLGRAASALQLMQKGLHNTNKSQVVAPVCAHHMHGPEPTHASSTAVLDALLQVRKHVRSIPAARPRSGACPAPQQHVSAWRHRVLLQIR